jgi:small subunit ribosomal protein S1
MTEPNNFANPDDLELEKEIEAALGDMSLADLYHLEEEKKHKAPKAISTPGVDGVCRGKIIAIHGDDIFVDLGGKSQGYLPHEELDPGEQPQVGQELDVVIVRYDSNEDLLILSKKSAEQRVLKRNLKIGSLVEARVVGSNKGGLELDIKGIRAFMPISQIDMYRVEDLKQFENQKLLCEVVEVERGDKNIVLSRRNVLEREAEQKKEQIWQELDKGQTHHGVVRSVMDYGAFVDIGGVEGLLHVSEMSWARVKHPGEILQPGQGIDVLLIGVDKDTKRISLSLKQAGVDPWTLVEQKYVPGSKYQAQIVKLMDFGAFAQLEPGVDGLIPISEMTWAGRIRHPGDVVSVGAMVEVQVMTVDMEKRRISMSMKGVQENPWTSVTQKYFKDNLYPGTVKRVTDFGAFVELEPGIEGLVHISELSSKHVKRVQDVVKENDTVEVKVLNVDPINQRISLSLKYRDAEQLAEPSAESVQPAAPQTLADKKKKEKDRPRRGGLDWNWL